MGSQQDCNYVFALIRPTLIDQPVPKQTSILYQSWLPYDKTANNSVINADILARELTQIGLMADVHHHPARAVNSLNRTDAVRLIAHIAEFLINIYNHKSAHLTNQGVFALILCANPL